MSKQERRRRWIAACRLESLNVTRHTRICSKHFEGGLGPTKANPVPTIFDFAKHLQWKEAKQRQDPEAIEEYFDNKQNFISQTSIRYNSVFSSASRQVQAIQSQKRG